MADPNAFIRQILPYAVEVGDRYGIDPVTIITQAALETGWGEEVAGHNYFGIKSHGQPGGKSVTTHEEINGKRVKVQDNFRTYGSLAESVDDYGRFLSENPRYAEAVAQQGYPEELAGIAASGYATSSKYPKLVQDVARSVTRRMPPLPPANIPNVVGTALDVVPPRAGAPVTSSPDLAQMRRTSMPSRLIADSFAQLPQRAGSSKLADSLAMSPIQGGKQTAQPFDAAFDTRTGTMRMLAQPEAVSSQGLGVGTSRAPISLPRSRPVVQQSASDRARGGTPAMPRPRPQTAPPDLVGQSFQRVASANPTRLPAVPASTLGQPPATRVVQSVPMPPISTTTASLSASDRARAARRTPTAVAAIPDRLMPTPMAGSRAAPPPVVYDPRFSTAEVTGNVAQTVRPTGPLAPVPRPTIARAVVPSPPYRAVATELDTSPLPALPRPRPDLGMGGVDIPGDIAQTGQVAPIPAPRLQRGGIFGKPQIFGHDIKLPGAFGMLQGLTQAMNNASGPFNNGADNSLYNALRGGDFNTPGAATAQAGGYLYAPKPGGGFINVGRANPGLSGAALYDSLNRRNERADDAANRVNGSGGSSGAQSLMGGNGHAGAWYGVPTRNHA